MKSNAFGIITSTVSILSILFTFTKKLFSKKDIITSILTVALADSMADGLGIYTYETSNKESYTKSIHQGLQAMFSKLLTSLVYVIPFIVTKNIEQGILISSIIGTIKIIYFSNKVAEDRKEDKIKVISTNFILAFIVVFVTYYISLFIESLFN